MFIILFMMGWSSVTTGATEEDRAHLDWSSCVGNAYLQREGLSSSFDVEILVRGWLDCGWLAQWLSGMCVLSSCRSWLLSWLLRLSFRWSSVPSLHVEPATNELADKGWASKIVNETGFGICIMGLSSSS